ncbi:hypothetical protein ACFXGI_32275 [Streptomyces sp. NPDC059355]|uniref:hypothetical protein n=1 Tax=Streptomyces sp. NPDC059355 TaxID=3346811 RepID=UPI0036CEAED4
MSTPEEQRQQQQSQEPDPYGTQTWQSDTWETGYQPVQPPPGALPGRPVVPDGWFRDEAAAAAAAAGEAPAPQAQGWTQAPEGAGAWPEPAGAGQPAYGQPGAGQPAYGQSAAPEGWFRDEAPAAQAPPAGWQPSTEAPAASAAPAPAAGWQPGGEAQAASAPAAGWGLRDEAAASGWAPGGGSWTEGSAAEQTAYLPPQPAAPAGDAAEQTAFLPPYPGPAASPAAAGTPYPYPGSDTGGRRPAAAAAETAYLPPYPGPAAAEPQAQPVAPEGWFRDEAPAAQPPAPGGDWARGGSGADWAEGSAVEQTAYLPPQAAAPQAAPAGGAAEQTAFLPPYPGPDPGSGSGSGPEEQAAGAPAPAPAAAASAAEAPADGEEPEYSPPTLGGNTLRAVDPAQARAEGLSPIIDPGPQPAVLTAALGLLLAGAAAVGDFALLAPLIVLQGLTAAGWFRLNGMWPARQGIALAFLGALVADAAVLAVDDTYGPGAIIGTLGAWVLLTLVLQLRSHADPDERMHGLMASVASAALAIVCAGYLAADSAAVSVGAAAVAVAVFTRALPLPTPVSVGVSLAAATGAGIAVGGLTSVGVGGALLGLAAGVCALIGLRVAAYDYPSKFVHMTAGVALPLAAAAPAVYLIGRVVG